MPTIHGEQVTDPKIVHYALFGKPWHYDHVANEKYFWHYAKHSPYLECINQEKVNFLQLTPNQTIDMFATYNEKR